MEPLAARYIRFVSVIVLIAILISIAFWSGYRLGYLDGMQQFEITASGQKMRLVPVRE